MCRLLIATLLFAATASAAVTRVEITDRGELSGYPSYERIVGKIHFAVDPNLVANRIIVDIDLAPRNAQGLVEFTADLYMLRPVDPAKGNGTALFEVSNRGGKGMLGRFDLGGNSDPRIAQDLGDPLLFEQGFTLVWVGWEWDVPKRPDILGLNAPRIPGLTGVVRAEIIRNELTHRASLGDWEQTPYAVADPEAAMMTLRDDPTGPSTTVPRSQWRFSEDGTSVEFEPGFEPGRIYEVIYEGKDPALSGLGSAAVRDYISYLKQTGAEKRAIGFGTSQSGRFLRTFVYDGFNADEHGARVFDGVWPHVGGAGRGSFNIPFGQPSRDGHPRRNRFYPTDIFPFSDLPQIDSGLTDSLLGRATAQGVVPKIFYTNGSYEYWGRGASLIHITVDGRRDFASGPESRIYYLAGTQHVPSPNPVRHDTENLANPQDYRFALRALLLAMNAWITNGVTPPDSRMPLIAKKELVTPAALAFPKIPGVHLPKEPYIVYRLDFGPDFRSKGIIDFEPPKIGQPFPILVPQVDTDGNEISGVRLPEQIVPLATYTGWNLRAAEIGAPDVTYDTVGSFLPFPHTRADREKMGDPRLSIEECYQSREVYVAKVAAAAEALVRSRFLIAADVPKISDRAAARWDSLMNTGAAK
jgi:hypothetical protein